MSLRRAMMAAVAIAPTVLKKPSWFTKEIPFDILLKKDGDVVTTINPDDYIIDSDVTYYLSPTGDDSNDGLTPESPKKSIASLITSLNAAPPSSGVTLHIASGTYSDTDALRNSNPAFDLNIICNSGRAILRSRSPSPTFTLYSTGVYTHAGGSNDNCYIDTDQLDAYGTGSRLVRVATVSEVEATPASFCVDSGTAYIHLHDGGNPSGRAVVLASTSTADNFLNKNTSNRLFIRNVDFWGGRIRNITINNQYATAFFDNCKFMYALTGNAMELTSFDTAIFNNCLAGYANLDNFSYRGSGLAVEVDCIGVDGGYSQESSSDNGTTTHHEVSSVRINSVYTRNGDRSVHDIDSTKNWLIKCKSGFVKTESTNWTDSAAFLCGVDSSEPAYTLTRLTLCESLGGVVCDVGASGYGTVELDRCVGMNNQFTGPNGTIIDV